MALDRIDALIDQKSFTWKLVNSLWIAIIIIGLGVFSLLGWIWAGILAKSPRVWRAVILWGVVLALSFLSIALGEDRKVILGVSWVISGRRYDDGPPPWDIMGV